MKLFHIGSKAGLLMGVFEGEDPAAAVAAMDADANGVSNPDDWSVVEVVDVIHEHGATLYLLDTGDVIVERGPHRICYESLDAAREALAW